MANPPPPYDNLTGISRTVMKDNQQATIADYSGNARPAEMTVNINTNEIYIGNATGALTKVIQSTQALIIRLPLNALVTGPENQMPMAPKTMIEGKCQRPNDDGNKNYLTTRPK